MSAAFGIDGLASGLDTNQIVAQLMQLERRPVLRLQEQRQAHEQADQAWNDLATQLQALQSAADTMASRSTLAAQSAVTSSNEAAVAATGLDGASPQPGATTITVDQLATAGQLASTAEFSSPDDVIGQGAMTIRVGGNDIEIQTVDGATVQDLARMINDLDAGATARVLKTGEGTFRLVITSRSTGEAGAVSLVSSHGGVGGMDVTQQARNALITVGGLQVERSSNQVDDLIEGVALDLRAAGTTTIRVEQDLDAVTEQASTLVGAMNSLLSTVSSLGRTSQDEGARGPLAGDTALRSIATRVRDMVARGVDTGDGVVALSQVGIELTRTGEVTFDEARFRGALADDFDGTVALLSRGAAVSGPHVAGSTVTSETATGSYDVVVTQAATRAAAASTGYTAPTADTTITITQQGTAVDVLIEAGATRDQAVAAINEALQGAGVLLEASADGGGIALEAGRYGDRGSFETTGASGLLGTELSGTGLDVAGMIDGQAATGTGRLLRAEDGPAAGLSVEVTVSEAVLADAGGSMQLGPVTVSAGFAGGLGQLADDIVGRDGEVARARDRLGRRIDAVDSRIERFESRLELRERTLLRQFTGMEQALARLMDQGMWLEGQLAGLPGR